MSSNEYIIEIKNISKSFGDKCILDDVSISVKKGEFVTILGPSGCGKTTLLRLLAGFGTADKGEIRINGEDITNIPPHQRPVNTVFQRYALFPHLDVYENIAFGLKLQKVPAEEIDKRVMKVLKMVSMTDYEDRDVESLSGGQQQRVAIARALAMEPDILCFDEPTSALDPELTGEVLKVIRSLAEHKTTMVIVTHEMAFARDVADQIIFMDGGVVVEQGDAKQVIDNPQEERTKQFLSRYSQG